MNMLKLKYADKNQESQYTKIFISCMMKLYTISRILIFVGNIHFLIYDIK